MGGKRTVPSVLAIGDGMKPQLDLFLQDILHSDVLDSRQLFPRGRTIFNAQSFLQKVIRTEERAKMLSSERRVPV